MEIIPCQCGPRFTSYGICGKIFLQFIICVVRNIADTASVNNRRFFFFRKKSVKFRVVAGGNNQGIYGPFIAIDFNDTVLDDPQINLNQIFFVLIYFIGKMDASARHTGKSAPSQVKTVRVVGICNMKQSLDGLFAQQIDR